MNRDSLIGIGEPLLKMERPAGILKGTPEDFIVEEIPLDLPQDPDGKYTIFSAVLRNWDTNRFVQYLARQIHISKERISYAGTKDKRGITRQYFCIDGEFDLSHLGIQDVTIDHVFRSNTRLGLGMLRGNRFRVNVGDIKPDRTYEAYASLQTIGGFPNYFGPQRFGSIRVNSHRIGELIVRGKYEDAVMLYIYDPLFDQDEFRKNFHETRDARKALQEFPMNLSFERSLLGYIAENGKMEDAFDVFPRNLRMIFIHAFQSYLFNRMLSLRLKRVGNPLTVFPGDIVVEVDNLFNKSGREIQVNSFNIGKIQSLIDRDLMRPVIKLFGHSSSFSDGIMGDIEREVLGDITQDDFRIAGHRDMWSSGDTRVISARAVDFRTEEDGTMAFSLGKGMYATVFLREIIDFNI